MTKRQWVRVARQWMILLPTALAAAVAASSCSTEQVPIGEHEPGAAGSGVGGSVGIPCEADNVCQPACTNDPDCAGSTAGSDGAQGGAPSTGGEPGIAGAGTAATAGGPSTGGQPGVGGAGGLSTGGEPGVAGASVVGGSAGSVAAGGASGGYISDLPVPADPGPYGYCSDSFESYLPNCPSSGHYGSAVPELGICGETCLCHFPCTTNDDCPPPATGTAVAECVLSGYHPDNCRMSCNNGEICPDGMSCVSRRHEELLFCAWVTFGEDNFGCWLQENPDYCAQHTTQEACEARMYDVNDPRQPWTACMWATETIYSTASDNCEPVSTQGRCLAGFYTQADLCAIGHSCSGASPAVYWADLGAGTASLLEVHNCHFEPEPRSGHRNYGRCEFGTPTLPLLCDCACESP